jgi:P4 family phage/plasmid primase-like protien
MTRIPIDFSPLYGPRGIVAFDQIPEELRALPNWVMWREERREQGDGAPKPTKVLCTIYGVYAKSTDPRTWTTFDEVRRTYRVGGEFAGIGFVFQENDGYVAIDLDHCITREEKVDEDGEVVYGPEHLSDFAKRIVEQCDSYTEISPSGTGLHIIVKGRHPGARRKHQGLGFEMYANARYFTMTGDRWPGTPATVEERGSELVTLYASIFGSDESGSGGSGSSGRLGEDGVETLDLDDGAFDAKRPRVISKERARLLNAGKWRGGYPSQSEAEFALCIYIAAHQENPTVESVDRVIRKGGLYRPEWDRKSKGEATIRNALRAVARMGTRAVESGVEGVGTIGQQATHTEAHPGSDRSDDNEDTGLTGAGVVDITQYRNDRSNGVGGTNGVIGSNGHTNGSAQETFADSPLYVVEDDDGGGAVDGDGAWDEEVDEGDDGGEGDERGGDGSSSTGLSVDEQEPAMRPRTDIGNAERLALRYGGPDGEAIYVPEIGWYAWNGIRWKRDMDKGIMRMAINTVRAIYREAQLLPTAAAREEHGDHAMKSESGTHLREMVHIAETQTAFIVQREQLDADPWLICCVNGVIDVRTGKLTAHRKDAYITKAVPVVYDPDIDCSKVMQFLDAVTDGDEEYRDFILRAIGYALTGDVSEEVMFLVYGGTETGKSTFLVAMKALFADYCITIPHDTLLARKNTGAIRNDIAMLRGARMAISSELKRGAVLDEDMVKRLTGGDQVTARFLNKEFFEFKNTAKFFITANDSPKLDVGDDATMRRILRLPFDHRMTPRDPNIKKWMATAEASMQWLALAVRGAQDWLGQGAQSAVAGMTIGGLRPPECVIESTNAYKEESDPIAEFVRDCCVVGGDSHVYAGELYQAYVKYASGSGMSKQEMMTSTAFGRKLADRFEKKHTVRGALYHGIGLLIEDVEDLHL